MSIAEVNRNFGYSKLFARKTHDAAKKKSVPLPGNSLDEPRRHAVELGGTERRGVLMEWKAKKRAGKPIGIVAQKQPPPPMVSAPSRCIARR